MLVLGGLELEAAGEVHVLLPPVLQDGGARDPDIGDAVTGNCQQSRLLDILQEKFGHFSLWKFSKCFLNNSMDYFNPIGLKFSQSFYYM